MAWLPSIRPPGGTLPLVLDSQLSLDVRRFSITEGISSLFSVTLEAFAPSSPSNPPRLVIDAALMLVGAALRFVWLGLLVLFAFCISAWLLGCGATGADTQGAWAQTTPNGMRLFRICRRHPHVDPNARYWYDVGDGTPRTTFLPLDEFLEGREANAVFIHDPHAPPESRKLLGIAFQHLPCDKPPPPPPEKLAAKEKEGAEKKDETKEAERPKSLPKPIAELPARCPEPGQARRRGGTGARTCTRTLVYASERSRQPSFRRVEEPLAAKPRPVEAPVPIDPSQVPPSEVRVYEDWRQTPEETALLDRAQECLTGACHARHKNFQPKGGKKPAGTHNGQSLSTGSGRSGGASAPKPAPQTTVKTTIRPNGYREKLAKATGKQPPDAEAHHVFPIKHRDKFEGKVDLDNPRYGTWWDKTQHKKLSYAYNKDWQKFFDLNRKATTEQILAEGRRLAQKYGLSINF